MILHLALFLSLATLWQNDSKLHAQEFFNYCIPIPERAANPARDPFNNTIPAANILVRALGKHHKHKPTIVFIHGFAENISEWNCTQNFLKEHYFTVAVDLRGYGRSTKTPAPFPPAVPPPAGEINYTQQVFADDLHAVLNELSVYDNIILVGHSVGSSIAINYATTYPGVKKLVLVSGSPVFFVDCTAPLPPCITTTSPEPFPNCSSCDSTCCDLYPPNSNFTSSPLCCIYPKSLQFSEIVQAQVEACIVSCPAGMTECPVNCVLNLFVKPYIFNEACTKPSFSTLQQNYAKTLLEQELNPVTANILTSTILFASSQDQRSLYSQIHIPTLICSGTIDADVDPRNGLYMHQHIYPSSLAEFVGKGHQLNLTDVKHFNKLLAGFIKATNYCDTIQIGKADCCNVCESAFTFTNFTECTTPATE